MIGNGFDLAHDLPTEYNNFLDFCIRVHRIYTHKNGSVADYEQKFIYDIKINEEILTIL